MIEEKNLFDCSNDIINEYEKELFNNLNGYSVNDIIKIYKAYDLAKKLHDGQFRKSGEPYIMHPLSVAIILSQFNADSDTICAGLLHDTLEDTNISKNELSELFNSTIADLVDGVTKIRRIHFQSKREQNLANMRKIITSLTSDVRIIIIKLADRLHNMRTLEFHTEAKQKEIALETMEVFVPLAKLVGPYSVKTELEDLSLKYLYNNEYKKFEDIRNTYEKKYDSLLTEMKDSISEKLLECKIDNKIYRKIKNVYGIYKNSQEGIKINEMHDLLSLKIIVESKLNCYYTLGLVHDLYHPLDNKFKDYICKPKKNCYESLHTTVFSGDTLVQTRIRTFDMDKIAYKGLTAKWDLTKDGARDDMQKYFSNHFGAYRSVREIDKTDNDEEFLLQARTDLFADKIYVYTPRGDMIELPKGATAVDFAYYIHSYLGNNIKAICINDEIKQFNTQLKTGDRVLIITEGTRIGDITEECAITARAKRKIRENNLKNSGNN